MPATSKAQQRFMGMVHAAQKGELKNPSGNVARAAKSMSSTDAEHFAATKHKGLPEHVKESTAYVIGHSMAKEAWGLGSVMNWSKSLAPRFTQTAFRKTLGEAGQLGANATTRMMRLAPVEGAWNRGLKAMTSGLRAGIDPAMHFGTNYRSATRALGSQASGLENKLYSGARGASDWVRRHPWLSYTGLDMGSAMAGQPLPSYVGDAVNMAVMPRFTLGATAANAMGLHNPFGLQTLAGNQEAPEPMQEEMPEMPPDMYEQPGPQMDYASHVFG